MPMLVSIYTISECPSLAELNAAHGVTEADLQCPSSPDVGDDTCDIDQNFWPTNALVDASKDRAKASNEKSAAEMTKKKTSLNKAVDRVAAEEANKRLAIEKAKGKLVADELVEQKNKRRSEVRSTKNIISLLSEKT